MAIRCYLAHGRRLFARQVTSSCGSSRRQRRRSARRQPRVARRTGFGPRRYGRGSHGSDGADGTYRPEWRTYRTYRADRTHGTERGPHRRGGANRRHRRSRPHGSDGSSRTYGARWDTWWAHRPHGPRRHRCAGDLDGSDHNERFAWAVVCPRLRREPKRAVHDSAIDRRRHPAWIQHF